MSQRRVVRDMRGVVPEDVECELDGEVVGETGTSPSGYQVRVQVVRINSLGLRVRLLLLQHGQLVRFLDLTTLLCRDLAPLVETAARLGGDVTNLQDGPWWDRVSTEEYRSRVEQLTDEERMTLSADIRAALQVHQMIWETQKSAKAKIALQRVGIRKRIITESLRTRPTKSTTKLVSDPSGGSPISARAARRLERGDHQTRMLFWIGRELDARYGREVSEGIFNSARTKIGEEVSGDDGAKPNEGAVIEPGTRVTAVTITGFGGGGGGKDNGG